MKPLASSKKLRSYAAIILAAGFLSACTNQESYRDVRPEHWTWWGADMEKVDNVMQTIKAAGTGKERWDDGRDNAPGNWTYEFAELGKTTEAQAKNALSQGDRDNASELFHEASVYYGLAKYPHISPTPAEDRALEKQWETYRQAMELRGYGYEAVNAEFKGETVKGYLHLPKTGSGPFPVVIGTAGLDVFGAESGPLVVDLLDRGIAVVMTDIPGTGINRNVALDAGFEGLWLSFLAKLESDNRIDTGDAGAFGISFGGNAAGKLAMAHQDKFKAVANICGPVHEVFQVTPRQVASIEPMYIDGLVDRMQLTESDPKTVAREAKQFSLIKQGLLGDGQTTRVPVMSLNARNDYVAPLADMELITQASKGGFIVWSGQDDHCPKNRMRDMPKVAEFFDKYLG